MTVDWDQRQLCADGNCVGLIGSDGTCKVCGRAALNWGDERRRGLKPSGEIEVEATPLPAPAPGDVDEDYVDAESASDDGELADDDTESLDDERRLCPDGACVGVIGADGHCKLCGKAATA